MNRPHMGASLVSSARWTTPAPAPDPSRTGRLSRDEAAALLAGANAALAAGDFRDAAVLFGRVVGFDDPALTAAALLGLGEARYRLDEDDAALAVVGGRDQARRDTIDLSGLAERRGGAGPRMATCTGAIEAYREADRRAPATDKAEIATRLGWLTKETGDPSPRGAISPRVAATHRSSRSRRSSSPRRSSSRCRPSSSPEGASLVDAFALDKVAVAAGEYWRLWTVTLVHGSLLHLFFNMYALYLAGPIVERWYGPRCILVFYLACAAAGSIGSFVFGGDARRSGASGAVFGLFGLLLTAVASTTRSIGRVGRSSASSGC